MLGRRVTLRLALACDNRCVFCAQRGLDGPGLTPEELPARLAAQRAHGDRITFVGGEPTLVDWLPEAVAAARAAGFVAVGVQTHARHLDAQRCQRLVAAGLTDVHVSVHGATAAIHDYHTDRPGSFAALWSGVAAARAAGATVVATTVVTRSSFRTLAQLPPLLLARGVAAWQLSLVRSAGEAAASFDRMVPRLGMALPFALHALDGAARRGLPAFVRGVPRCALGTFASRLLLDGEMAYAATCGSCSARAQCDGVDAAYLARWGDAELSPCASAPSLLSGREQALAALFVGTGELAAAPLKTAPVRRLPLAGKVQPARGEVSAAAPRKSGEALREILPALFSDGEGS